MRGFVERALLLGMGLTVGAWLAAVWFGMRSSETLEDVPTHAPRWFVRDV